jgi:hypothetical protein
MTLDLAVLTNSTKKRGAVWLVVSLVFFGVAIVYLALLAVSAAIHDLTQSAINIFDTVLLLAGQKQGTGMSLSNYQISRADLIKHLLLVITLMTSYLGIWYGVMLIASGYKKYTFQKARVLALLFAFCFAIFGLTANAVYEIRDDCQIQTQMQIDCESFNASLVFKKISAQGRFWLSLLLH